VTTFDLEEIQGLLAHGYGRLKAARFVLIRVTEPAATRAWLRQVLPSITTAAASPHGQALNLAFTATGLERLGLPATVLRQFSHEFVTGMTTERRRRVLGDTEESAPEHWPWGGPTTPDVDGVVLLYGADPRMVDLLQEATLADLTAAGLVEVRRLETSPLGYTEHFGFVDGISQPAVEGLHAAASPADTLRAGELVLGYRNEYDRYTSRPLLDRQMDPDGLLPLDEAGSGSADLGRNGTYLVLRQLEQHVRAFWDFVGQSAGPRRGSGEDTSGADGRIALAAKFVGRWPSGAPLARSPGRDDTDLGRTNEFGYAELDAAGERCPIGAHIRRANPRDALDPFTGAQASLAIVKRHRILRRGRLYGDVVPLDQLLDAESADDDQERGLHFLCLCANLARQFEFIQHTWVNNSKFGGLYDDVDPIAGSPPDRGGTFTMPAKPVRRRAVGVPRFTTVRGGAYFFLPGMAALRYLARER
jgi:Dyp-type peroxidase family